MTVDWPSFLLGASIGAGVAAFIALYWLDTTRIP
jgi:predicted acylesterase/phospholipase RssA